MNERCTLPPLVPKELIKDYERILPTTEFVVREGYGIALPYSTITIIDDDPIEFPVTIPEAFLWSRWEVTA